VKRLLGLLLGPALGGLGLSLLTATSSYAAPEDYAATSDIGATDAAGDATDPGGDVTAVALHLDPTYRDLRGRIRLGGSSTLKTYVVVGLGTGTADACTPEVEVVVATHSGFALVRPAGSTDLPIDFGSTADRDLVVLAFNQPLLDGRVPQCATTTVVDRHGVVLDTAATVVMSRPVAAGAFTDFEPLPPLVLAPAEVHLGVGRPDTERLYDVHQDVTGEGISGDHLHRDYDDGSLPGEPGGFGGNSLIRATPGLHTVTVTVTAGNAAPVSTTFQVWGAGGPSLPATGSLAGRAFLATSDDYDPRGPSVRTWVTRFFLDHRWTWRAVHGTDGSGSLGRGVPERCGPDVPGCSRYAYDVDSGQVEILGRRGVVSAQDLYFDNLAYPDRLALPRPGDRLDFRGRMTYEDDRLTLRLALHRDGTYARVTARGREHGSYRIDERGRLTLVRPDGSRRVSTIAYLADDQGRPRPRQLGVWALGVRYAPVG
jgi:hypothetical protein